jgi:predicted dehydrogenase
MGISRRKFCAEASLLTSGLLAVPSFKATDLTGPIRIGVIGTGSRGGWLTRLLRNIAQFSVVGCCDVLPSRLEEGLAIAGKIAKGYKDYRQLLDLQNLDAVIIATPLSFHTQMAIDALDAGKHIYCEKTMSYSTEEAIRLSTKVRQSNLTFQVGYQHRFNELYNIIFKLINGGYCGTITHVECHWNRNGNWRRPVSDPQFERLINWRLYNEYSGGLVAELCSHQIDIVNWMLNKYPEKIIGLGGIDFWKDGRETFDNVFTSFQYPGGIKASFHSITTNAGLGFSMRFLGTKATIEIKNEQGHEAYLYEEDGSMQDPLPKHIDARTHPTKPEYLKDEGIPIKSGQSGDDAAITGLALKHFADCIFTNQKPLSNVDNGRSSSICVHLANSAIQKGIAETWRKEYTM